MTNDLEGAAHASLERVRALRARMEEGRLACDEALTRLHFRVGRVTEQLDSDRKDIGEAIDDLYEELEQASLGLSDHQAHLPAAMVRDVIALVATASEQAGGDGKQVLMDEAEALRSAIDHLHDVEAQLARLVASVETASRDALRRAAALADALAEAVDEAEQLLSIEFASVLSELGPELEEAATATRAVLDVSCPQVLDEVEEDWNAKLSEVFDLLQATFRDMREHAGELAAYTVDRLAVVMEQEVDELATEARALEVALEDVSRLADKHEPEVDAAGRDLAQALEANRASVGELEELLNGAKVRWRPLGFLP